MDDGPEPRLYPMTRGMGITVGILVGAVVLIYLIVVTGALAFVFDPEPESDLGYGTSAFHALARG
ncbi:hypothetical protein GCM10009746_01940 [Microbacterium paludicola]